MDLVLKSKILLSQLQISPPNKPKDWDSELLPVFRATLNPEDFVFMTGSGEVPYSHFLQQLEKLYYAKGFRMSFHELKGLYGTGSVQYQYKVYFNNGEAKEAGKRAAPIVTGKAVLSYDSHGKAIRLQPSQPEDFDGIFRALP